tara:strand:- start:324 stop:803 length:480 start_codon:yes stop_codon:yes gene_type:complete
MIKNILGCEFKYENDKFYRLSMKSKKWKCCNDLKSCGGYNRIAINKKRYPLHRLIYKFHNDDWDITDSSKNNFIDHININPLDNRIENLRILNASQNSRNIKKKQNCSSKYIGVCWDKLGNKWRARIEINGKKKSIGQFDTEEEASEAYQIEYDKLMKL